MSRRTARPSESFSVRDAAGTDTLPPIRQKPHQVSGPAQAVWHVRVSNIRLPSGVYDLDKTLVEGDTLDMATPSSLTTVSKKGKGKGKAKDEFFLEEDELMILGDDIPDDMTHHLDLGDGSSNSISRQRAKCGICFDDFRVTVDPYRSALAATSSADKNKGLEMPCGHKYCLGCASQYLKTELEKQQPVCEWSISCPEVSMFCSREVDTSAKPHLLNSVPQMTHPEQGSQSKSLKGSWVPKIWKPG